MFQDLSGQNNIQDSTQIPVQRVFDDPNNITSDSSGQQPEFNDDMHYMPDKFLVPVDPKKNPKNVMFIVIISLLAFVLLCVAGFAVYAFILKKPVETNNNAVLNLEPNQNATSTEPVVEEEPKTAFDRDKKRIKDITDIRSALALYFGDVKKYPNTLMDLNRYLQNIPKNPNPNGEEYLYEVRSDNSNYKLIFTLEEGGAMGGLTLLSGRYQAKPDIVESFTDDTTDVNNPIDTSTTTQVTTSDSNIPVIAPFGTDTDNDGLTDKEEVIFNTIVDNSDTDKDNYKDGEEVVALYDPTDPKGKIVNNVSIAKVYINKENLYSLIYPAKWQYEESEDKSETSFLETKDQDFIKVEVEDNPQGMTPKMWYANASPSTNPNDLETFVNKNEVFGIKSKDGYTVYLSKNNKIYIVSYIMVNRESLEYSSVFKMILQSFRFNSK